MKFRKLKQAKVKDKVVLVRVDFNVPFSKSGRISDDFRIRTALPTIKYLRSQKAKIVLMSHLGRPKKKDKKYSLAPVARRLQKLLRRKVKLVDGNEAETIDSMKPGEVILLENLRFNRGETTNDVKFAKKLASFADIYVNDSFATSHRKHASVVGVTKYLPSYAGFLLEKELEMLNKALKKPKRPYIAIIGGAKVEDKIEIIKALLKQVDAVLIGGAMMFTFLKASGERIGRSLVENNKLEVAKSLMKKAHSKIILPTDCVVAHKIDKKSKNKIVDVRAIPSDMIGLDVGPETIAVYNAIISSAKTIVWNGPLGLFEIKRYAKGTQQLAKSLAKSDAVTIIGGGDSADAVRSFKLEKKFTHVSTGGGASLDFFTGKTLPGIKALEQNYSKNFKN
jgi:3-phosphoglycerate kinase